MSNRPLSNEAAQVLADKIAELDRKISQARFDMSSAMSAYLGAIEKGKSAYEERQKLAMELGEQASPDFVPRDKRNMVATGPAPLHVQRFLLNVNPFPQPGRTVSEQRRDHMLEQADMESF